MNQRVAIEKTTAREIFITFITRYAPKSVDVWAGGVTLLPVKQYGYFTQ